MSSLMAIIGRIAIFTFLLTLCSTWLHEMSHWIFARFQTKELRLVFKYRIFPVSVKYRRFGDFSPMPLALTGIAPQLCLLSYVVAHMMWFGTPDAAAWVIKGSYPQLIESVALYSALAGGLVISPADLFAVFCQDDFRKWEELGYGELSHLERAKVFVECLRSR